MSLSNLFRRKPTSTIIEQGGDGEHSGLNKVLNVRDLTFLELRP